MMGVNILRALAVVASLLPAVLAARCGPEYFPVGGTCVKVVPTSLTWSDARARCQAEDPPADLFKITPEKILEDLSQFINTHYPEETGDRYSYWVGGHGANQDWRWVDGSKLSIKSNIWLPDEPSQNQRGFTRLAPASAVHGRRYLVYADDRTIASGFICEH
ncbi:rheacalcin-1-like [Penaeus indicus]|uniref:rheacalcin-1-like n=1 Tax=Penaeus indicus TaxID=29960 RepID=UPI00300CCCAA